MQTVGSSGLTAMTTAQITAMADSDFTSCASLLGGVSGYSSDQETALANVAKRATVWGDPSTWSSSNIQQAGVIVQALTTTEIQSMTWTIDEVSRMGDFDGWDETKKVAIVSTWLSSAKSNDASTITASELQSLSHMTCGLSTAQISALTTYSSAADSVGEVTSCSEQQMVEFANLAKVIYTSNVASWSSVQIAAVGVHIGGLSQTEISTLTETQIDNISPAHITYMPSSAFSGLTVTQIGTLSTAQAQSTTSTQRSALSSEQLTALETVSGISYSSTTSENGK
ncbi:hypothetical protein FSP39_024001 [Pinctada imbricata]|uniref:Uncharacterized protein n=1 Tax=Pinctada imbricata TaxID=66713 RepID=A0AA88Y182_PINIB|nr:hypothetical protein FSP39_024001 [Pinctada imbricata]